MLRQIRMNLSRFRVFAIGVALIIGLLICQVAWRHYHNPDHTFQVLDRIESARDVEVASGYLTPTGKHVLLKSLEASSGKPSKTTVLSKQIERRKATYRVSIQDSDGTSLVDFILVKDTFQWKFDDVWVESVQGKKADMLMSYVVDHPYKAAGTMMLQNPELAWSFTVKLVQNFLVGYRIGQLLAAVAAAL
jgi:hypothetical protein